MLPGQASSSSPSCWRTGRAATAQGYVTGIRLQTDELARHARFLADARAAGDLAGVKRHAEHVYNLIAGSLDPKFGDLMATGAQNPGDGFGAAERRAGWLPARAGDAATAAKAAPTPATASRRTPSTC